jgi:hypothetical protein
MLMLLITAGHVVLCGTRSSWLFRNGSGELGRVSLSKSMTCIPDAETVAVPRSLVCTPAMLFPYSFGLLQEGPD